MKKTFLLILITILIPFNLVLAESIGIGDLLEKTATVQGPYDASTDEKSMSELVGTAINAVLSLLGVVFISLLIYGGYNHMIARGDSSKMELAQDTMRRAIVGLVIIVGSWAIWQFIFHYVLAGGK